MSRSIHTSLREGTARQPELAGRGGAIALGDLGVELGMAAILRGIPDAPTVE